MLLIKYEDILSRPTMLQLDVWSATALEVAKMAAHGGWLACQLKKWTHTLIANHEALPQNIYGLWNTSLLQDEDLAQKNTPAGHW